MCARETAAEAVSLGRKTTERDPHVSEVREGKAGWAGRRPLGRLAGGSTQWRGGGVPWLGQKLEMGQS
jgi:hypothetical protein